MNFLFNSNAGFKLMIIAFGIVVVGELIWAGRTLTQPVPPKPVSAQSAALAAIPSKIQEKTTLSLTSSNLAVKVGEQFTVSINILSPKPTDGADIIISYDPRILSVVKDSSKGTVAKTTAIYTDYPLNTVDDQTGRITVSGINSSSQGIVPKGLLGTVTFVPKRPGQSKISFDFTPSSTTDSNVIENKTAKDILEGVQNLEINITQ